MSGYVELDLWLHEYELAALEEAVQGGVTAQAYLQAQVIKAYEDMVPPEIRRPIQERIEQERAEAQAQEEANRRFAVFHVTERGMEEWFLEARELELLNAARELRTYMDRKADDPQRRFANAFPRRMSLTPAEFKNYVGERLDNTGRVTGAFEIDLDCGEFSALNIMDGWRTFPVKDVCTAAYRAFQKQGISEEERWNRLLERLAGREITAGAAPAPIDAPEQPDGPETGMRMKGV